MASDGAVTAGMNGAALWQSFAMIIVSELGDKTFLIAAILAMRNPQLVVFGGAFAALAAMSLLSSLMGQLLPALIPKLWTQYAAALLFLAFGLKMLQEARGMEGGSKEMEEEMQEAMEEIDQGARGARTPVEMRDMEGGVAGGLGSPSLKGGRRKKGGVEGVREVAAAVLSPVFVQAFVLTFLGEWGDRSQISTIALAAAHGWRVVTLGTVVGHGCCTALAVVGGRWLACHISIKNVTFGGAVLFLIFGIIYFREAWIFTGEDASVFA